MDAHLQWHGTTGKFGVGKTNERGVRLLEFAKNNNLAVANTFHNHKLSRRTTWHSPDGHTHNQIDYILISKRMQSSINKAKTRTFPSADIGSDHDLVMMTFKFKIRTKKKNQNTRVRYDLEKLKDPLIKEAYQKELRGRFAPLMLIDNLQELNNEFTNIVNETANNVLGKARRSRRPWITTKVLEKCDVRREAKKERFKDDEHLQKYREVNKETKKETADAKKAWIQQETLAIEDCLAKNNTKKAYNLVTSLTKQTPQRLNVINDKDGNTLTNTTAVVERWKEYCEDLYNHEAHPDKTILHENIDKHQEDEPPIIRSEVEDAIKALKCGKAPGLDNITAELIKAGGDDMVDVMLKTCNECLSKQEWPTQWTEAIILTIHKKGNIKLCENFRTISLISHSSKVLLRILQKRIEPRIEAILKEEQAGFRKNRSTVEQIGNLRMLCEKYRNHQKYIFHNFIDFKKAFDRVWHDGLWHTLENYKIGKRITMLIKGLYEQAKSTVMVNNDYSSWFTSNLGEKQGCILSPMLFNLFLERIMTDALEGHISKIKCGGLQISNLRFADDIDVIAGSEEELRGSIRPTM